MMESLVDRFVGVSSLRPIEGGPTGIRGFDFSESTCSGGGDLEEDLKT